MANDDRWRRVCATPRNVPCRPLARAACSVSVACPGIFSGVVGGFGLINLRTIDSPGDVPSADMYSIPDYLPEGHVIDVYRTKPSIVALPSPVRSDLTCVRASLTYTMKLAAWPVRSQQLDYSFPTSDPTHARGRWDVIGRRARARWEKQTCKDRNPHRPHMKATWERVDLGHASRRQGSAAWVLLGAAVRRIPKGSVI